MKRSLLAMRLFAMLLLLVVSVTSKAIVFEYLGVYYNDNTDGTSATVTYITSEYGGAHDGYYSGSISIPESVMHNGKWYRVTAIGSSAFYGCLHLKSVTIPESVTKIGESAFADCADLTSITIPDNVVSIGNSAFYGCSGLKSIVIGSGIRTIGSNTFHGCTNLASVDIRSNTIVSKNYASNSNFGTIFGLQVERYVIGDDVTNIGGYAFYGCSSLTSVTIPNSVTSIGNYAFYGCSSLTSVTIPNSVTSISNYAFYGCSGLTSITIPNSVTSIGGSAFSDCSGLTSINIPNSVTSIGGSAFKDCSNLTSVSVGSGVPYIGGGVFSGCNIISVMLNSNAIASWSHTDINGRYTKTNMNTIFGSKVKEYIIGDSVRSIGGYAFAYCSGLTSITIPESVTTIGDAAFCGCSGLTSITIPNSVTSIGGGAFRDCSGLTSITIPNSVTSIGSSAFENCLGLTSLDIRNSVTSIGSYAFYDCAELTSVNIGNNVTSIGDYAFWGCSGFNSIDIPNSVTSIGKYAFRYCARLMSIDIPNSVTTIGKGAFMECPSLTSVSIGSGVTYLGDEVFSDCDITSVKLNSNAIASKYGDMSKIFGSKILEFIIGDTVTDIASYAFENCSALTSVTIGNGMTEIGSCFFMGHSRLKTVTIGNNVTSIGGSAFEDCSGLTSITIPNSVTSIGGGAFYGCSGLTSVTIPNSVTSIGGSAFEDCSGLTSVTIPNSVTSIGDNAFKDCSSLTKAEFASIESLCGILFNHYDSNPLYYAHHLYIDGSEVKNVVIPNSVKTIGNYAFENCSGLTSITIPESVTTIGDNAFLGCSGLTKAEFASIESLCNISFVDVSSNPLSDAHHLYINGSEVTDVVIPEGVMCICSTFEGCSGLKSVTIPNSVKTIGNYAFRGCSGLTSIDIPNSVTSIEHQAFARCSGLTSIDIPNSVTSIGSDAFAYCSGLTSITFPESVTTIGDEAFYGCSGLTSITIPNSVTSIGDGAFYGCNNLPTEDGLRYADTYLVCAVDRTRNTYTIKDGTRIIGRYAFEECPSLTSIDIPYSVSNIGGYAFYACSGLTSINIPNSVTSIGESAFRFSGLTSITIPKSVTIIGNSAFSGCSGLTSVIIPNSVTSIGGSAFSYCQNLKSVTCMAETVPLAGYDAFYRISRGAVLYVPATSINAYTSANQWKDFGQILPLEDREVVDSGPCGENVIYTLYDDKRLVISGTGIMTDFASSDEQPWKDYMGMMQSLVIENGVTSIGRSAFDGCSNLTSITIPNSVTSIGERAFRGCSRLTSIDIPESVTSIGDFAFDGCSSLTSVTLNSDAIVSKHYNEYNNLEWIFGAQVQEYIIGGGVTSIGNYAFYGCSGLTSITIPNSVKYIGIYAFRGCESLPVTDNIRYADTYLVETVDKTKSTYIIKEGTRFIGEYAFYGCSGLTSITIPESVKSFGYNAFFDCSNLKTVTCLVTSSDRSTEDLVKPVEPTMPEPVKPLPGIDPDLIPTSDYLYPFNPAHPDDPTRDNVDETTDVTVANVYPEDECKAKWLDYYKKVYNTNTRQAIQKTNNKWNYIKNYPYIKRNDSEVVLLATYAREWYAYESDFDLWEMVWNYYRQRLELYEAYIKYGSIPVPDTSYDEFGGVPLSEATLYVYEDVIDGYKAISPWRRFGQILPIDPSAVNTVQGSGFKVHDGEIFDLMGRRLSEKPKRGYYIQNGKKQYIDVK